jgi:hypothetical protein
MNKKQEDILTGLRSELEANVRSLEEILSTLPGLVKSPRLLRELRELRMKNEKEQRELKEESYPVRSLRSSSSPPSDRDPLSNPLAHFDGKVLSTFMNLPGARFSVASTLTGSFECSGSPPPASTQSNYGTALSKFETFIFLKIIL